MDLVLDLEKNVGGGYDDFINTHLRYRVIKGSRGSKKSCTISLQYIYDMMYYGLVKHCYPNLLVIRRYQNTNWDSTRAQLIWAINKLGVGGFWKIPKGEHTLTLLPTGQQILFRGLDDPQSIQSITVSIGNLCWVWFEEAFQIPSENDFDKVDMSIRGQLPEGLYNQITMSFNPWSDRSWLKKRFFDQPDDEVFACTTTYMCNEFLSDEDRRRYEKMKVQNPRRYRIEGLGEWGISEGLIYENWKVEEFDIAEIVNKNIRAFVDCNGMDFGYTDPTAMVGIYADKTNYKIYIYYEYFKTMMENRKIANQIVTDGFGSSIIRADSEDPRTINELRGLGLRGIRGAKKGSGSVLGGIQKLQDYEIIVHPRCTHTIEALSNYAWKKDKLSGSILPQPEHDFSHIPDAIRYGCEDLVSRKLGIHV